MGIQEALLSTLKSHGVEYEYCESIWGYVLECIRCGNVWTAIPSDTHAYRIEPTFPLGFGRCPDGQNCSGYSLPEFGPEPEPVPAPKEITYQERTFQQVSHDHGGQVDIWLVELPTGERLLIDEGLLIEQREARKLACEILGLNKLPFHTSVMRRIEKPDDDSGITVLDHVGRKVETKRRTWLVVLPDGAAIIVTEDYPIDQFEARKRVRAYLNMRYLPNGTKLMR